REDMTKKSQSRNTASRSLPNSGPNRLVHSSIRSERIRSFKGEVSPLPTKVKIPPPPSALYLEKPFSSRSRPLCQIAKRPQYAKWGYGCDRERGRGRGGVPSKR